MDDSSSQLLSGRSECKSCVLELISSATRRIYLLTQRLEPDFYHYKEIYRIMAGLAQQNRKAEIRIITHDSRVASYNGHFLIKLAQKLPSYVQVRTTVTPKHRLFSESWLIIDERAFMRVKVLPRFEGNFDTDNRLENRSMCETFMEFWEASQPDQNTRWLNL